MDPSRGNRATMRSQAEARVCVLNFADGSVLSTADLGELSEHRGVFNHSKGINGSGNSLFHP